MMTWNESTTNNNWSMAVVLLRVGRIVVLLSVFVEMRITLSVEVVAIALLVVDYICDTSWKSPKHQLQYDHYPQQDILTRTIDIVVLLVSVIIVLR